MSNSPRILIFEDDKQDLKAITRLIHDHLDLPADAVEGVMVSFNDDFNEAFISDKYQSFRPNIIITDGLCKDYNFVIDFAIEHNTPVFLITGDAKYIIAAEDKYPNHPLLFTDSRLSSPVKKAQIIRKMIELSQNNQEQAKKTEKMELAIFAPPQHSLIESVETLVKAHFSGTINVNATMGVCTIKDELIAKFSDAKPDAVLTLDMYEPRYSDYNQVIQYAAETGVLTCFATENGILAANIKGINPEVITCDLKEGMDGLHNSLNKLLTLHQAKSKADG